MLGLSIHVHSRGIYPQQMADGPSYIEVDTGHKSKRMCVFMRKYILTSDGVVGIS